MDKIDKMSRTKLKLSDLNPHLMCVLCGGYYIDATTIVECLHSFCRSCIVKHLESSKYCPICEVQVHKTKPLVNIRPDKTLQDIVYKLVPGLYANEMRNRRKFYRERPHYMKPNDSELVGEISDEAKIHVTDENITLSLDYHGSGKQGSMENSFQEIATPMKSEKRYFKCPTGVTIYHLQKLLKAKYDLNDSNYKVEIYFKEQPLHEDFTLLDISYIYLLKSKGTLDLTFKIYENIVKRQKIEVMDESTMEEQKPVIGKLNSVTLSNEAVEANPLPSSPVKPVEETSKVEAKPTAMVQPSTPVQVSERIESKPEVPVVGPSEANAEPKSESRKAEASSSPTVKLNGVVSEEVKEVQLQISESGVMSVSQIENGNVVRTVEESAPKMIDTFRNKSNTGMPAKVSQPKEEVGMQERMNRLIPEQSKQPPKQVKPPYKSIRTAPKTWNPVIPKEKLRPTLMKNSDEPKKSPKFFKMRNMPRFLGNPASGVKPMYAESSENDVAERRERDDRKDNSKALKNILKINPKTLRPIEKDEIPIISTPSTPNLLTNPFIPNNNHLLFSDPLLLHPNAGNFSNLGKSDKHHNNNNSNHNNNTSSSSNNSSSSGSNNSNNNSTGKPSGSSRPPIQNGTFPPICFPTPEYCTNFFPYQTNFPKPGNFYAGNDKLDPLIRASRMSPFANIPGFNIPGFHASLPPSISLLLKHQAPHHHFKKSNPTPEKKSHKDESTKETNKNCDDNSLKVKNEKEREDKVERIENAEKVEKRSPAGESSKELKDEAPSEGGVKTETEAEAEKDRPQTQKQPTPPPPPPPPQTQPQTEEGTKTEAGDGSNKDSNNDNRKEESDGPDKPTKESTCQEETSACNAEAKPETIDNNDNKSVNDTER